MPNHIILKKKFEAVNFTPLSSHSPNFEYFFKPDDFSNYKINNITTLE
jgi:hypothetical protein